MVQHHAQSNIPNEQLGPAERLLSVALNHSEHLWHHRPGIDEGGRWRPARGQADTRLRRVQPGLFEPAAERLYGQLLAIHQLNTELMARLASWAHLHSEWRDLKVACAALMLVQNHSGQPHRDSTSGDVEFYDDDLREIGEAMILDYEQSSTRMLSPKAILRVAQLLESPAIARLNRLAGFGGPASAKPFLGRWPAVARKWLRQRERNPALLEGLVRAGFKQSVKAMARKVGYRPESAAFFIALGWKQSQCPAGHRLLGFNTPIPQTCSLEGRSELEICTMIRDQRLSYKQVVGQLPAEPGFTPAIMAALVPSLSDRDLRQLTPTLENLGLLEDQEIAARWRKALEAATDQRGLHIAKRVRSQALREQLEDSADGAIRKAVESASGDKPLHLVFLVDRSGSMQGAIEKSIEALSRILAGFPRERLHVASFDTMGQVHRPKAESRAAVTHMFSGISAGGGTLHSAALYALHRSGVKIPSDERSIVLVVGDEAGEPGQHFADALVETGFRPAAMAMILNVAWHRGDTVRDAAAALQVPFCTVEVEQFDDPYQVPRMLQTILEAPVSRGTQVHHAWVEKVMATPRLSLDQRLH